MILKQMLLIVLLTLAAQGGAPAADSIDSAESEHLLQYLAQLQAGQPGRAASVEELADVSFAGLRQIIEAYVDLEQPVEPQTHRAFQALIERSSRMALAPWPLVTMYSAELSQFLIARPGENPLAERLLQRLLQSGKERRASDLAVRLVPQATLRYLLSGQTEARVALLEAWNRQLARAVERRPIDSLDQLVAEICGSLGPVPSAGELVAGLQFLGSWPKQHDAYLAALRACLKSADAAVVSAALTVQQRMPAGLEWNEAVVSRFSDHPTIVEAALKNYAFDSAHDHSAVFAPLVGGAEER